jgi:hypothetical protein
MNSLTMNTLPVKIGDLEFPSKKEACDYTRSVLDEVGRGTVIDRSHPKFPFFDNLLNNHSDRARKVGCGLASFGIQRNARDGRYHETYLLRTDGTKETFSWRDCASQTTLTPEQKLTKAYRVAIESQIDFVHESNPNRCVVCGKSDNCSVDHKDPTFYILTKRFEAQVSLPIPRCFNKQEKTNAEIFTTTDKPFEEAWKKYHEYHAVLQILCDTCHKEKTIEDNKRNAEFRSTLQSSAMAQPDNVTSATLG